VRLEVYCLTLPPCAPLAYFTSMYIHCAVCQSVWYFPPPAFCSTAGTELAQEIRAHGVVLRPRLRVLRNRRAILCPARCCIALREPIFKNGGGLGPVHMRCAGSSFGDRLPHVSGSAPEWFTVRNLRTFPHVYRKYDGNI
jgi:hypothetical protein